MISIGTKDEAQTITAELWNSAPSAEMMLAILSESRLRHTNQLVPYERHLHLFAASCARRINHLLIDHRSRVAIQTAELFGYGRASTLAMYSAYAYAKAATVEIAKTYNAIPIEGPRLHPTGVHEKTLYGAALLHAAAVASTCCSTPQIGTPVTMAAASAKYTTRALYWEQLSIAADSVLISELIDQEEHRQAHSLRIFVGNPFAPNTFPSMTLPSPNPDQQEESCTQQSLNAA